MIPDSGNSNPYEDSDSDFTTLQRTVFYRRCHYDRDYETRLCKNYLFLTKRLFVVGDQTEVVTTVSFVQHPSGTIGPDLI